MTIKVQVCPAKHRKSYCTLPVGHSGPHGINCGGGLIVAPWDGAEIGAQEETNLFCEYCGFGFLLTRHGKGGTFDCSGCEQFHDFSDRYGPELYHTSGPATRLYPSKMDRTLEVEFVNWRKKCFLLTQGMLLILNEITQAEHDERAAKCEADVTNRLKELSEPQSRIKSWLLARKDAALIEMGARGYSPDGSGGEIAVYLSGYRLLLLAPTRFSYWLFNTWCRWK